MTQTITNLNTIDIEDSCFGVENEKYVHIANPFNPEEARRIAEPIKC